MIRSLVSQTQLSGLDSVLPMVFSSVLSEAVQPLISYVSHPYLQNRSKLIDSLLDR